MDLPHDATEMTRSLWAAAEGLAKEVEKMNGPAEAATSPSHGSDHPFEDYDMNETEDSAPVAENASREDWREVAYDLERAIDTIRHLVAIAEETLGGDGRPQVEPGVITVTKHAFYETHALLTAIGAISKQALEPTQ